jgi:hypothetical protein
MKLVQKWNTHVHLHLEIEARERLFRPMGGSQVAPMAVCEAPPLELMPVKDNS